MSASASRISSPDTSTVTEWIVPVNVNAGFVSATQYAASFDALGAISSDIDPRSLAAALEKAGFAHTVSLEYPLPNGKTLVRQDFRSNALGRHATPRSAERGTRPRPGHRT